MQPAFQLVVGLALLACLQAPAPASAAKQVQAVFQMIGPCFRVPDAQIVEAIMAINGATGLPWGNAVQSGGFRSLCDKMKESTLADCDNVPSVSLAPEIIRSPPPPPVFSDIENTDNPFGRRLLAAPPPPSPRAGPRSAAPAPAPANAPAPTPAPAPAPSPARSPPARSPCPADSKWYLYLDTTNPPSADSAALSLKGTVDDGDLLAALKRTDLSPSEVSLMYLNVATVPDPPPPPPPSRVDLQAIVFLGGVAGPLSADQLNGTATALEGLTGLPWGSVEQSDSLAQLLSLDLFPKSLPTGKGTYVYAEAELFSNEVEDAATALKALPKDPELLDALAQVAGVEATNVTLIYLGTKQDGAIPLE